MHRVIFSSLSIALFCGLGTLVLATMTRSNAAEERTQIPAGRSGPLAKDGDVEIVGLQEKRERRAYAVPRATTFRQLRVQWSVAIQPKGNQEGATYLYRFLDLKPVQDDTTQSLAENPLINSNSPAWPNSWPNISQEVSVTGLSQKNGKSGHQLEMILDAPARRATKITALQGKLEVVEADFKRIEIRNLRSQSGKTIVDPDLKEIKITPIVKKEGIYTMVSLQVTGKVNRLWDWRFVKDVTKDNAKFQMEWRSETPGMQGYSTVPGGRVRTEGFQEDLPNGVYVVLDVLVPVHRHTLDFHLKEIELP